MEIMDIIFGARKIYCRVRSGVDLLDLPGELSNWHYKIKNKKFTTDEDF